MGAREFLVAAWTDEHAPAYSTTVNLRAGAPAVPNLEVQLEPGLLTGRVTGGASGVAEVSPMRRRYCR